MRITEDCPRGWEEMEARPCQLMDGYDIALESFSFSTDMTVWQKQ